MLFEQAASNSRQGMARFFKWIQNLFRKNSFGGFLRIWILYPITQVSGINFFDTADIYGLGHSEELLGKTLAGNKEVIIATKAGNVSRNNKFTVDYFQPRFSPEQVRVFP